MPRRRAEATAAELLGTWTDSDTAMQIVGTSLGVFGEDLLDPEVVLAKETPLRNALFDVLLSLVEGGALDVRPTGDGHYAFRWRADYAVGALSPETATTIDIEVPSPYLAELADARRERDEALERAESAEALAGERERHAEPAVAETVAPVTLEPEHAEPEAGDLDDDEYDDEYDDEDLEAELVGLGEPDAEDVIDLNDLEVESAEVVYLTPPAPASDSATGADEREDQLNEQGFPGRSKWRPYTLDKPRSHLSSVERFAKQG